MPFHPRAFLAAASLLALVLLAGWPAKIPSARAQGSGYYTNDLVALTTEKDVGTGLPLLVRTKVTGHILRLVPAGMFTMGSEAGDADEKPVHTINKSVYYLGVMPVSNTQYEQYDPAHAQNRGKYSRQDGTPVTQVSWNDAAAYILWVGQQEGAPDLYAMPSEGAWEKAAQGGLNAPKYPSGNTLTDTNKIYSAKGALPINAGAPNGLGFLHMTGNVMGWCWDWYDPVFYKNSPSSDPYGAASGKMRSVRGGTWYVYDKSHRCADRFQSFPETKSDYIGIRIGRRIEPAPP